jgi:effector-binding domain-containing protein
MPDVTVATVPAHTTAVVRCATTWEAFPRVWRESLDEVYAWLDRSDLRASQRWNNVMLYLDDVPNVEVGVLIERRVSPAAPVVASQLPAGAVASAVHRGPYDQLGAAHDAIHAFCRDRALPLAGPRWEIYGHPEPAGVEVAVHYLLAG